MRAPLLSIIALTTLACSAAGALAAEQAQPADQWRASKLVGVRIYGPDNKLVGKVSDVLMSHDGHAQSVVLGVGGFLGIGEKDVSLPFDQVTFSDKPLPSDRPMPGTAAGSGQAAAIPEPVATPGNAAIGTSPGLGTPLATASPTGVPATAALGATPATMADNGAGAVPLPPSTSYPDHGSIALTFDQLKSAPTFTFAR